MFGCSWQTSPGADVAEPTQARKVPVPVDELVRRIRDAYLNGSSLSLRGTIPSRAGSLGTITLSTCIDLRTHVLTLGKDIENLGRDLGVLKPWETLKS